MTSVHSASYLAFSMIFQSQARVRLQQTTVSDSGQLPLTESGEEDADLKTSTAERYSSSAIQLAHRSAQILRDFRERHGLKISPAWLLQLQAVAAGVLVADPELANPTIVTSPGATENSETITTSAAALEEVFRCLLGTGVEIMIARAIARMTYLTALKQKVTRGYGDSEERMSELLTKWEALDL